jgi:hypothetical protein
LDRIKECFGPQVSIDMSSLNGKAASMMEVDDWVRRCQSSADVYGKTLHYVSNQVVEMLDDEAVCSSHLLARHWKAGEAESDDFLVLYGIYSHRLQRTPLGWRITDVALDARKAVTQPTIRRNLRTR